MPSPICTVNGLSTTNGITTTSGSLITIQLVDSTGVNGWSISCTNTDNRLSAATITAAMSVNQSTKTATLTMPSQACALQFTSIINGGVDSNGVVQPSYTTTFGVFILSAGGLRMLFTNETTESSQTYGWISDLNAVVLAGLTTTNATTIQGNAVVPTVLNAGLDGYMMEWVNANNDIEWVLIKDKNVATNAAIAGTKISPNFGNQTITLTSGGSISLPSGTSMTGSSGSTLTMNSGSTATFNGVNNTTINGLSLSSGSSSTLGTSATLTILGTTTYNNGSSAVFNGKFSIITRAENTNYTCDTTGSDYVIMADSSGGSAITITLPPPTAGRRIIVTDAGGAANLHTIQINPNSTEKISGSTVRQITSAYGSAELVSNGTNWFITSAWGTVG